MALTEEIDNYPGYDEGIDGFTLAEKMQAQAERFGAKTEYAQVDKIDLKAEPKVLETSEGTFYARTVVIATGANPRELGLKDEASLVGRGVAYCAACDGMRYKGKTVVLVGGGNSAAADGLILSRGGVTAEYVFDWMEKNDLFSQSAQGNIDYFVTDDTESFRNTASLFLGSDITENVHQVSLSGKNEA